MTEGGWGNQHPTRWGVQKSHLLLYYFASAWIVSEHTNTSKNVKATLTVVMPRIIMRGLSSAGTGSLRSSSHPLEREINPLKMPCGCPCCGATKNSHSCNPIALCSAPVNVLLHIPRVQLGNATTVHLLLGLKLPSQAKPSQAPTLIKYKYLIHKPADKYSS